MKHHLPEKKDRLTDEQEKVYISKYQRTGDVLAVREIVMNRLPFIKKKATERKLDSGNSIVFDDLVGNGVMGLIQSIKSYDSVSGIGFMEYASSFIDASMEREQTRYNSDKVPRHLWKLFKNSKSQTCFNCHRRCVF